MPTDLLMLGAGALGFLAIVMLVVTFSPRRPRNTALVQRPGPIAPHARLGIPIRLSFQDKLVGRVDLRFQQLDIAVETKTKDNLLVHRVVAVQYFVLPDKVYEAFCKFDAFRDQVTPIEFETLFEKKDMINLGRMTLAFDTLKELGASARTPKLLTSGQTSRVFEGMSTLLSGP